MRRSSPGGEAGRRRERMTRESDALVTATTSVSTTAQVRLAENVFEIEVVRADDVAASVEFEERQLRRAQKAASPGWLR